MATKKSGKGAAKKAEGRAASRGSASRKSASGKSGAGKSASRAGGAKKSRSRAAGSRPAPISREQWALPASYCADGTLATLREVADPQVPTLSLPELSAAQRADVVVKRIEAQPEFRIAMVGAGLIDKERAIAEVKSGSKVGRALMEIEQRVINNLVDRAARQGGGESEGGGK